MSWWDGISWWICWHLCTSLSLYGPAKHVIDHKLWQLQLQARKLRRDPPELKPSFAEMSSKTSKRAQMKWTGCVFFPRRVCSGMIWFWGNYTEKKNYRATDTHIDTLGWRAHFSRSLLFGEFHLNSLFHTKRLQLITLAYCIFFWCVHFLCVRHQHKQPAHLKPSPSFHLNWQFTPHSLYNLSNVIVSWNVKEPRWCVSLQPQQLQLKIIYIVSTINFGGQSWGDRLVLKYSSVSLPPGRV